MTTGAVRFRKTMLWSWSGDHTGSMSFIGFRVIRVETERCRSTSQYVGGIGQSIDAGDCRCLLVGR